MDRVSGRRGSALPGADGSQEGGPELGPWTLPTHPQHPETEPGSTTILRLDGHPQGAILGESLKL